VPEASVEPIEDFRSRLRTWSAALREEARIKRLRRPGKDALIAATRGAARRRARAAGRPS